MAIFNSYVKFPEGSLSSLSALIFYLKRYSLETNLGLLTLETQTWFAAKIVYLVGGFPNHKPPRLRIS